MQDNDSERETEIEDVFISRLRLRTGGDTYLISDIKSVHVHIEGHHWRNLVVSTLARPIAILVGDTIFWNIFALIAVIGVWYYRHAQVQIGTSTGKHTILNLEFPFFCSSQKESDAIDRAEKVAKAIKSYL